MVTITNYFKRENAQGQSFITLELQGDVELIQSSETGRFYATNRKCTISSTFNEEVAKTLIGKQIKGSIIRVQSEAYEYVMPATGEIITLSHRWEYTPDDVPDVLERSLYSRAMVVQ